MDCLSSQSLYRTQPLALAEITSYDADAPDLGCRIALDGNSGVRILQMQQLATFVNGAAHPVRILMPQSKVPAIKSHVCRPPIRMQGQLRVTSDRRISPPCISKPRPHAVCILDMLGPNFQVTRLRASKAVIALPNLVDGMHVLETHINDGDPQQGVAQGLMALSDP